MLVGVLPDSVLVMVILNKVFMRSIRWHVESGLSTIYGSLEVNGVLSYVFCCVEQHMQSNISGAIYSLYPQIIIKKSLE